MIKKLLCAVFLSSIVLLVILQNDPWIKQSITTSIKTNVEKTYGIIFTGTVDHLNVFSPRCELIKVTAKPIDSAAWQWRAERLILEYSWWHLLWYQRIDLHITLEDVEAVSDKQNTQLYIADHIYALFNGSQTTIPVIIKSLTFNPGS